MAGANNEQEKGLWEIYGLRLFALLLLTGIVWIFVIPLFSDKETAPADRFRSTPSPIKKSLDIEIEELMTKIEDLETRFSHKEEEVRKTKIKESRLEEQLRQGSDL